MEGVFDYLFGFFFLFLFACAIRFVISITLDVLKIEVGKLGEYSFRFILLLLFVVWNADWFVFDHFLLNYEFS